MHTPSRKTALSIAGLTAAAALILGGATAAQAGSVRSPGNGEVVLGSMVASFTDVTMTLRITDFGSEDLIAFRLYSTDEPVLDLEGDEPEFTQHIIAAGPGSLGDSDEAQKGRLYQLPTDDGDPKDEGAVKVTYKTGGSGWLKVVVPWRKLNGARYIVVQTQSLEGIEGGWLSLPADPGEGDHPFVRVSKAAPELTAKLSTSSIKKGSSKSVKTTVTVSHNVAGKVTVSRGSKVLATGTVQAGASKTVTLKDTKKLGTGSQKLTVKFTPTDSGKYASVTKTVTLKVTK